MASPISLCAIEKRVRLSIMSSTSLPCSLKYSATAVAVWAAFLRSSAGLSEVATITTDLLNPSSPRSLSINSLTSRPRSPMRAMTLSSALVFLANIPISVDFPTPDPANIPIRCPLPRVMRPSTAFTPSGRGSVIMVLFMASGLGASNGYQVSPSGVKLLMGRPSPSKICPKRKSPTCTDRGCSSFSTIQPEPMPSVVS
ncbi:MAG: hypothetical protein BWY61_01822 [Firmicutes bacterium ADurb.Bin354]|nr:MAG: hypothetical protein BWY61_01822 [Firmicutes bacterium ADurb.Bin354]